MKLDRVEIKNFRSIEKVDVDFNPSCRVLVGINESGKSNILKALALLGENFKPVKKDDLREALPDEDPITSAFVRFIFKFEKPESDELFDSVISQLATTSKNPDVVLLDKNISLKDFCSTRTEGLYTADVLTEKKSFRYWSFDIKYKLLPDWKKPTANCPADFSVAVNGKNYQFSKYKLVRLTDFKDIPDGYLEDATMDDLSSLVGGIIIDITKANLPETLFWEYDEDNLLPSSVKIVEFATDPDICIPLKNMFTLAGIGDIKGSIEDKRKGTDNQFQNYLNGIAKKTTNHFRNVWKEYKNIEFSLHLNADQIIPGVKEKNTHDFSRRSDGFKRFVTFLLMISVNVKTDNIRDTLLLIDEPDISLHPSGARYLRDELIRISKTNYVIYSTHSIFMIDSGDIARHYIVKKKEEITSIESAGDSNIADEEVLYNALGHSIFAILNEKNIIFEGWNDKYLFRIALDGASAALKKKFKDVGVCHAKGVKTIKTITPMIELANRKCLVISDSDQAAKDQQKIFHQEKIYGEWKNYQEIDSGTEAITGEDFLKNDFILTQVKGFC
jgi:AAA15 family ATPase/GTPase